MTRILLISVILIFQLTIEIVAQERFTVRKASFSSNSYDEFCAVPFKDKLVFCSNQEKNWFPRYRDRSGNALISLFQVGETDSSGFTHPEPFSSALYTVFHEGPVSIFPDEQQLVYSRNLNVQDRNRNRKAPANTFGLFFSEWNGEDWSPPEPFAFNLQGYSLYSPSISPSGEVLYFASDMPGGNGGTDLYRSRWANGRWSEPENLGSPVNSPGNELYPFFSMDGRLFFSSDGHPGLGKLDLFYSQDKGDEWTVPTPLDSPLNSSEDDFGIYSAGPLSSGYFASNRKGSDDIFEFFSLITPLSVCEEMQENEYCYEFWDEKSLISDTTGIQFIWEFSDGSVVSGARAQHCFPGAGTYQAHLRIIDNRADSTFEIRTMREFEIRDHVQPFIRGPENLMVNNPDTFHGLDTHLPGMEITEYAWDFGDGTFGFGPEVSHAYAAEGTYQVRLGVIGINNEEGMVAARCTYRTVQVLNRNRQ